MSGFPFRTIKARKQSSEQKEAPANDKQPEPIPLDLDSTIRRLKKEFGSSPDFIVREFEIGAKPGKRVASVYIEGLVNKPMANDFVMRSMKSYAEDPLQQDIILPESVFHYFKENALSLGEIEAIKDWDDLLRSILSGSTVLVLDGYSQVIGCRTGGGESRAI